MSTSVSIQLLRTSANPVTAVRGTSGAALPIRLCQKLAGIRQRPIERHLALSLHQLGQAGVIADYQRAARN